MAAHTCRLHPGKLRQEGGQVRPSLNDGLSSCFKALTTERKGVQLLTEALASVPSNGDKQTEAELRVVFFPQLWLPLRSSPGSGPVLASLSSLMGTTGSGSLLPRMWVGLALTRRTPVPAPGRRWESRKDGGQRREHGSQRHPVQHPHPARGC